MSQIQTLTPVQVAGLDDPAVLTQCQLGPQEASGRVAIGLGLSGLHCASCALAVESALRHVPGVGNVQVQGATQRARLVIDPAQVKLSQLVQAVMQAGFQAWPDGAARAGIERLKMQRQLLWRLLVAVFCMMQVMMVTTAQYVAKPDEMAPDLWRLLNWTSWVLTLPVLVFSCGPFFDGAWTALKQGRIAMDTPVALGIATMFGVSTGVMFGYTDWLGHDLYFDSLTMFVAFLLFGRWLESRAREKVTQSLESICARLPEAVERSRLQTLEASETPEQALAQAAVDMVPVSLLRVGDLVKVTAGQAFAADGTLVVGRTEVDEALLTGESRPVPKTPGQAVVAGSLNLGAPVWCRVERLGADTRYQQVVSLVQQALTDKPGWLRVADRFAGPFLWAVLALAVLGGLAWQWIDPARSVWVAVSVLVVTCPCALSLAAPSALLAAAGALARGGVLVRHLDALEALATVKQVFFDKTGTLTTSTPQVSQVYWQGQAWPIDNLPQEVSQTLAMAASLAKLSQHPVAKGLAAWADADEPWTQVHEEAGLGLQATDARGVVWRLGSARWVMPEQPTDQVWPDARVWVAPMGERLSMGICLEECARADAVPALNALREAGVEVALLSGDQAKRVNDFAQQLKLQPPLMVAAAEASPEGKLQVLSLAQVASHGVAVVGDGINDAPMLARAQVSFAMDQGAALAQSQADFIVLGGRLTGVPLALHTGKRAMVVVRQNLVWAAVYNFVCIPLALMGHLPPWLAGLGMAISSLAVVLNALRVSRG